METREIRETRPSTLRSPSTLSDPTETRKPLYSLSRLLEMMSTRRMTEEVAAEAEAVVEEVEETDLRTTEPEEAEEDKES